MPQYRGAIAQLGERLVRNEKVEGSNPFGSTTQTFRKVGAMRILRKFCGGSLMVELLLPKQLTRVRFPFSAPS